MRRLGKRWSVDRHLSSLSNGMSEHVSEQYMQP
jgi:hypothetical protein